MPLERKRELYAICAEFDIVIIEDDPYYYLQFGVRSAQTPRIACKVLPTCIEG